VANYEIYEAPAFTVAIAHAQPQRATFEQQTIGAFANGSPRRSRYARVVWQFPPLTSAEYATLLSARPADGLTQFKTFTQAGTYVKHSGVLQPITTGTERDGTVYGVQLEFTQVEPV
jgi:hypothetical protein